MPVPSSSRRPPGHFRAALTAVSVPLLLLGLTGSGSPGSSKEAATSPVNRFQAASNPSPAAAARRDVISARLEALRSADPTGQAPVWVFFTDRDLADPGSERAAIAALPDLSAGRRPARRQPPGVQDLPVAPRYLAVLTALGARVRHSSRWLNAASVELPLAQVDRLAALPFVRRLEPVHRRARLGSNPDPLFDRDLSPKRAEDLEIIGRDSHVKFPSPSVPLAPATSFPAEEALHYSASFNQNAQIGVIDMHRRGYTGAGVRVLILDSGFRTDHQATAGRRLIAQRDFVFHDNNVNNEPADTPSAWSHGTGVWSDLGGFDPGALVGVAYEAEILLAKTEDVRSETPVEEDNFVAALEWGDSLGADVASASLQYLTFDGGGGYTYAQLNGDTAVTTVACDIAASRGMAVVVANGNSGPLPGTIGAPADADSIIAAGAVDSLGAVAGFSSRGPTADGRIKPEVAARGVRNYVAVASSNGYGQASGTSFATPLTGGAAALLLEAHPDWTGWQVRQAMITTASHPGAPDNSSGYGLLNVRLAADSAPKSPPRVSLPFALISPARGATVPTSAPQLRWERSLPGTGGDTIHYTVYLASDPDFVTATLYPAGTDTAWIPPAYLSPGQTYHWKVVATNNAGWTRVCYMPSRFIISATAAAPIADGPPAVPLLLAARPNPLQPWTRLGFELPAFLAGAAASSPAGGDIAAARPYRLAIFDASGRLCRVLRESSWGPAGLADAVVWDGRDSSGGRLPGGVYFAHLEAGGFVSTTKVVIAR